MGFPFRAGHARQSGRSQRVTHFHPLPHFDFDMVLKWELECVELEWQARIFRRMPKDRLQSPVATLTREFGTTLPSAMASTGSSQGAGMSAPT
jgi:hypothetical protein